MARSRWTVSLLVFVLPAVVVVGGVSWLAWRQTVPGVQVELAPPVTHIGVRTPIALRLRAARGGVDAVELRIVQGQARAVVAQQSFAGGGGEQRVELVVEGSTLGLREGSATLEVYARDGFWRPFRVDDQPALSTTVTLDLTPPGLEVLAGTRYLYQGGGGLVALRAKGAARAGVSVGSHFFPAYEAGDGGLMVGLFALPWNMAEGTTATVTASDEAGNTVSRPVPGEIRARRFPTDSVDLSEDFLARKVPELLPERGTIPPDQLLAAFLVVNRDKRREAEERKREIAGRTQARPLWDGAFIQPRNTKVFSNFAETRAYRVNGQAVDTQVHLGYDLASLKRSPVPAANAGVVVYAGPLTIYGETIVLDHGLGLQTLYAHLSSIDVKEGDQVAAGQQIGRTGTTGLAVGDHLHYEVLIHGVPVTPVEWWDPKWIQDRILTPLREANVPLFRAGAAPQGQALPPASSPRPERRGSPRR